MPFHTINDCDLYYQVIGESEEDWIVFVHGVGADHESWSQVFKYIDSGYRILNIDIRGHGKSCKRPFDYSVESFSDDLNEIINALHIHKCHLVGFSLGGLIAQQFSLDYSSCLLSLVILSSIAGRTEKEKQRVIQRAKLLEREGALEHLSSAAERWFTSDFMKNNPEVMEWRRRKSLQNDPVCYSKAYKVLAETDLLNRLHNISVPTIAITGENDAGSPPHMSKSIANTVQNGHYKILPDLKHSILLEAPELVAREINKFVGNLYNN